MKQKDIHICSVSGGKDSTALYCLMVEFYGHNFLPIFADTGNEHPVTVNYVKNLHLIAGGPPVKIVSADFAEKLAKKNLKKSDNPFLDLMRWKGRAPSTKAQFCTEWLKLWPIMVYLENHHAIDNWIMYTGIRKAESIRRDQQYKTPFTESTYFDCETILPLLYETENTIFSFLKEKGVPPNPLYALGYKRVGCFPCIHANKTELSILPNWAWEKLEYWENTIGRSWFSAGTLPGKPEGYIPKINEVKEWSKTSFGGKNYDLFKQDQKDAPSCVSTWAICE